LPGWVAMLWLDLRSPCWPMEYERYYVGEFVGKPRRACRCGLGIMPELVG
jgi:hypothetical protein